MNSFSTLVMQSRTILYRTERGAAQDMNTRIQDQLRLALLFFIVLSLGELARSADDFPAGRPAESAEQTAESSHPLWQFGFGAGAGVSPHYPASDQSSLRILASPTFRYRGRVLRADDEGTRARLLRFENSEIDLSGAASFPVSSGENQARRGMRPLDWVGEGGPRWNIRWKFQNAGALRGDHLRLSLPFRGVASSDGTYLAHRGFNFQPGLSYEHVLRMSAAIKNEISVEFDGYASFIDETLGNYYFGVAKLDETPERRAYNAVAGLLNVSTGLTMYISPKDIENSGSIFFVGIRNSMTTWSANRASPLHKADQQFIFLAGFSILWINSSAREDGTHP